MIWRLHRLGVLLGVFLVCSASPSPAFTRISTANARASLVHASEPGLQALVQPQFAHAAQSGASSAQPSAPTQTQRRDTDYSNASVMLASLILALLAGLFWLLLSWANKQEQTSYLADIYRDSVKDFEYKRLSSAVIEKLQSDGYLRDVLSDSEWLAIHDRPVPPAALGADYAEYLGAGTAPPGLYSGRNRRPGSGIGGLGTALPPHDLSEEQRHAADEYRRSVQAWQNTLEAEINARYSKDLELARAKADVRAELAASMVDWATLRGRGAEFVLEFTALVVIIFAAVVLGVLGILGSEQIGTLLAAIAGYVLGRAANRRRDASTKEDAPPAPERKPEERKALPLG